LATGVVAGFVLSHLVRSHWANPETALADLTPGMIALLGGFSAEVVEQVLQRLIAVMVTAVRGEGAAQAAAEPSPRDRALRQKLAELNQLESADAATLQRALAELRSLLKP
jgi:hypothetical protein